MSDDADLGDDIVDLMSDLRKANEALRARMTRIERYLRDEGYGDVDDYGEDDDE